MLKVTRLLSLYIFRAECRLSVRELASGVHSNITKRVMAICGNHPDSPGPNRLAVHKESA